MSAAETTHSEMTDVTSGLEPAIAATSASVWTGRLRSLRKGVTGTYLNLLDDYLLHDIYKFSYQAVMDELLKKMELVRENYRDDYRHFNRYLDFQHHFKDIEAFQLELEREMEHQIAHPDEMEEGEVPIHPEEIALRREEIKADKKQYLADMATDLRESKLGFRYTFDTLALMYPYDYEPIDTRFRYVMYCCFNGIRAHACEADAPSQVTWIPYNRKVMLMASIRKSWRQAEKMAAYRRISPLQALMRMLYCKTPKVAKAVRNAIDAPPVKKKQKKPLKH